MNTNFIEDILKEEAAKDAAAAKSVQVIKEVPLNFDLGHLCMWDTNLLDTQALKQQKEKELERLTRDNTQLFINKLWELDTERIDGSVIAKLPDPVTILPRAKKIPTPRPPTKWEQFAKKKGIKKRKKDKLVYDEDAKEWRPRFGYRSKQNQEKEWVVEAKGDEAPDEAFMKRTHEKKERVAKNEYNRLKNIARATGKKVANNMDSVPPVEATRDQRPQKKDLDKASILAKASTASLGKFQEAAKNEKPVKGTGGKKRQFEPNEANIKDEKEKTLKLVQEILVSKPKINVKKAVVSEQIAEQKDNQKNNQSSGKKKGKPPVFKGNRKPFEKKGFGRKGNQKGRN